MNDNYYINSFLLVYRNVILRNMIFSYLGYRYRINDNLYRNGIIFHDYYDLQLSDIVNTGNIYLINEKLDQFSKLLYDNDSNSNSNNTTSIFSLIHKVKSMITSQNNSNISSLSSYKDWLDFNLHSGLINIFKLRDKYSQDEIDLLLLKMLRVFEIKLHELKDIVHVLKQFPITDRNLSIFNQCFDTFDICKFKITNTDILVQLIKQNRITISDYTTLIQIPLFLENVDYFLEIDQWNWCKCIQAILHQNTVNINLFIWVLVNCPTLNYNRYVENSTGNGRDSVKYKLFNVDIIVDNYDEPFFNIMSLALRHIELLEFTIKHYRIRFNEFINNENMVKPIDDIVVANRFIQYLSTEFPNKKKVIVVNTKSDDLELIKLFNSHSSKVQLRGANLFSTRRNVKYLINYWPSIFKSTTSINPNHLQVIFDELYSMENGLNIYHSLIDRSKVSLQFFDLKYIQHFNISFQMDDLIDRAVNEYLIDGNLQCFKLLLKENKITYQLKLCFIVVAIKRHSITDLKYLIDTTDGLFWQKSSNFIISFSVPFWFLANATSETEKAKAREIIDFFYKQNQEEVKSHFINNNILLKCTGHFLYLQDSSAFQTYGNIVDKMELIKCGIEIGDLALTKAVITSMYSKEYQTFLSELESLLIRYFNLFKTTAFKVPLYLFETYPQQFTKNTLVNLALAATRNRNFLLLDILLHRYKVRIIKPTSMDHDRELLEFNFANIKTSKHFEDCKNYDFSKIKVVTNMYIKDEKKLHTPTPPPEVINQQESLFSLNDYSVASLPRISRTPNSFFQDLMNNKKDIVFKNK